MVEFRPLTELSPHAKNARTHTEAQVGQIADSMQEWGWTNPVLVDEGGTIIAGHGRVLAAQRLGLSDVPVMVARGWSEAQKEAYVIADNQLALNAGWDMTKLALQVGDLQGMGFDISLLGFSKPELDGLIGVASVDPDEIPDEPVAPVSKIGDVWLCGNHRIMCGDCRDADHVAQLVNGQVINIAFTSPPYAEQREYDEASGFKPIHPDAYVDWFEAVAKNVADHIADDGSWFVNIKPSSAGLDTSLYVIDLVAAHVRRWGWHFATEFCWERGGVPKSVTQRFKNQFEPIYQFARGRWKMRPDNVRHMSDRMPIAAGPGVGVTRRKRAKGYTREFQSDIQGQPGAHSAGDFEGAGLAYPGNRLPTFSGSHEATGHAAAFPVGLPEFFVNAFTDETDLVYDPFLGSGSTIIAAEKTKRRGLGMELSPIYVDVAVKRWENFTGKQATLEETNHAGTQETADALEVG